MEPFDFLAYMVEEEHRALDKLITDMKPEELEQPLIENDDITIRERIHHILSAEFRMAGYLFADESDDQYKIHDFTIDGLLNASKQSRDRHLLTLENMNAEDLDKVWTSKVSGKSYSYRFLLWHFIEHISTHRGQVAMALRRIRD